MGDDEIGSLRRAFTEQLVDVKAADARLLLRRVAADHGQPAPARNWTLSTPVVYETLVERDRWVIRPSGTARNEQIVQHRTVSQRDGQWIREDAMNRGVALAMAEAFRIEPEASAISAELARLCCRFGLTGDDVVEWARRNDLEPAELLRLLREEAILRHLRGWLQHKSWKSNGIGATLDYLRLRGEYEDSADRAAEVHATTARHRPDPAAPMPLLDLAAVAAEHAKWTGVVPDVSVDEWASDLGFLSAEDVVRGLYELQLTRENDIGHESAV